MDKLYVCSGYYDLNIQYNKDSIKKTLEFATQLGYNVVAVNTFVEETAFESKKKKKGESRDIVDVLPAPLDLTDVLNEDTKKLKVLRRLTVEISDPLQAHKLTQSENFKKYDVVAVIPLSQNALQHTCSTLDVDIISFDPTNRSSIRMTRKIYRMAVDRGQFFELMYSPAINDSTARKNIISTAHLYYTIGKSQNIIVSSGAESSYDLRGPYDVMNLCLIFGMTEETAKRAICESCKSLYIRSMGRRCGKAVIWVSKVSSSDEDSSSEESMCLDPQPTCDIAEDTSAGRSSESNMEVSSTNPTLEETIQVPSKRFKADYPRCSVSDDD